MKDLSQYASRSTSKTQRKVQWHLVLSYVRAQEEIKICSLQFYVITCWFKHVYICYGWPTFSSFLCTSRFKPTLTEILWPQSWVTVWGYITYSLSIVEKNNFRSQRVQAQHGSTCVQDAQLRRGAWVCLIFLLCMPNSYLNLKWPAQDHTSRLWTVFPFLKCCCGKVWYTKCCNDPSLSFHIDCNVRVIPVT